MYDIYNGNNLGTKSLTALFEDKKKNTKSLDIYFKNLINILTIKKIIENKNKDIIDWTWDIGKLGDLDTIVQTPDHYMKHYFTKFTILPKNANIIKVFG